MWGFSRADSTCKRALLLCIRPHDPDIGRYTKGDTPADADQPSPAGADGENSTSNPILQVAAGTSVLPIEQQHMERPRHDSVKSRVSSLPHSAHQPVTLQRPSSFHLKLRPSSASRGSSGRTSSISGRRTSLRASSVFANGAFVKDVMNSVEKSVEGLDPYLGQVVRASRARGAFIGAALTQIPPPPSTPPPPPPAPPFPRFSAIPPPPPPTPTEQGAKSSDSGPQSHGVPELQQSSSPPLLSPPVTPPQPTAPVSSPQGSEGRLLASFPVPPPPPVVGLQAHVRPPRLSGLPEEAQESGEPPLPLPEGEMHDVELA